MYHGIILDLEFTDPAYPEKFKVFAKRKSRTEPWMLGFWPNRFQDEIHYFSKADFV